ncbi:hypothetical protein D7D52_10710 [Nocardia yunnanensis]|uniref:Uncharacterized protein n=1 Tax=Nocardia yunnanensis TaxID=2382165 RepID=A0A386ZCA8_9NOCA|nr:hypothetical protein [Nocardia yunnanensis]AYF74255.1 hypothetical protein D7D52_10710 [Nocardia yunnanensis]
MALYVMAAWLTQRFLLGCVTASTVAGRMLFALATLPSLVYVVVALAVGLALSGRPGIACRSRFADFRWAGGSIVEWTWVRS